MIPALLFTLTQARDSLAVEIKNWTTNMSCVQHPKACMDPVLSRYTTQTLLIKVMFLCSCQGSVAICRQLQTTALSVNPKQNVEWFHVSLGTLLQISGPDASSEHRDCEKAASEAIIHYSLAMVELTGSVNCYRAQGKGLSSAL